MERDRTPDAVLARLWELDAEYERLKELVEDPKLRLSALKQQADLLAQIAKHAAGGGGEEEEVEAERTDPESAVRELRELYARLRPALGL